MLSCIIVQVIKCLEEIALVEQACNDLRKIRESKPLIHSITNLVVMNETANAILCLGGLPIMSHAVEEVEEMVGIASALVLNIGTITPDWVDAMELAGKRANELGIPVILDPVGAGATKFRTYSSNRLLENVKVSVTRGNAAELASLIGVMSEVRGVESIGASETPKQIAKTFARTYGCTAAVTGAIDVISDGERISEVRNGHPMMGKVVGTGCISNVVIASFAAVDPDPFIAAALGLCVYGIAGELAAETSGDKPGTFHLELYNALSAVDDKDIISRGNIEVA